MAQIDFISSLCGEAYKSRNFVLDASTNGGLYFDSSDYDAQIASGSKDTINNAYYDVAVVVFNYSGTVNTTEDQVRNIKVSASATPQLQQLQHHN